MTFGLRQRVALCEKFQNILCDAAEQRSEREHQVTGPDGYPEMAWSAFERSVMTGAVSDELARRGITDEIVTPERIWREAELEAIGHSDYAHTYGLYCARIVERAVKRVTAPSGAEEDHHG
jgi:hypothetical protein